MEIEKRLAGNGVAMACYWESAMPYQNEIGSISLEDCKSSYVLVANTFYYLLQIIFGFPHIEKIFF